MASPTSFDDIRDIVRTALREATSTGNYTPYICDIGSDWVVYEQEPDDDDSKAPVPRSQRGYLKCAYHLDGDKAILDGKPVQVARVTTYEPVGGGGSAKNLKQAGDEAYRQVKASQAAAKAD